MRDRVELTRYAIRRGLVEPLRWGGAPDRGWESRPPSIGSRPAVGTGAVAAVRVLVLWNACRGVAPRQDATLGARRAREARRRCDGSPRSHCTRVGERARGTRRPCSWCLELRLADGLRPGELIAARPWREFLGDLRLLGMHAVVVLDDREASSDGVRRSACSSVALARDRQRAGPPHQDRAGRRRADRRSRRRSTRRRRSRRSTGTRSGCSPG